MNDSNSRQEGSPLQQLLDTGSNGKRSPRRWWLLIVLAICIGLGALLFRNGSETAAPRYRTVPAEVGPLVVKVSATGNLQPTNQVDVGSELSGIIDAVFVDVNDEVEKGQVLARLDLSKLRDNVAKSRANLAAAEAQLEQTRATTAEAKAALARYRQVAKLSGGKVPSQNEMDTAVAILKRAEANEASARASVTQAQASLQSDETDLAKGHIRSPINGVVLSRDVEPGQTVAASLQAVTLFTLAEDLSKMELQVDVDEADVGQVREGQKATFSVDAWPGRRYDAVLTRVGFGAQEVDGVVSYLTVLEVGNADLSLRPGMTGTAEITTLTRDNALLVPNAALRFSPPEVTGDGKKGSGRSLVSALMPRPPRQAPKARTKAAAGATQVWVLQDGQPVPVDVSTGATNGRMTEITGGGLKAGTEVITETLGTSS